VARVGATEGREPRRPVAEAGNAQRLKPLKRRGNVQDGLHPGGDHGDRSTRQRSEVGRLIEGLAGSPVHTTVAAGREHPDAGHGGQRRRCGHRGGAAQAKPDERRQIPHAGLVDVLGGDPDAHATHYLSGHPDTLVTGPRHVPIEQPRSQEPGAERITRTRGIEDRPGKRCNVFAHPSTIAEQGTVRPQLQSDHVRSAGAIPLRRHQGWTRRSAGVPYRGWGRSPLLRRPSAGRSPAESRRALRSRRGRPRTALPDRARPGRS
jgi:hypothetical protein